MLILSYRLVVRNLLLGYLTTSKDKQPVALRAVGGVLGFTEDDFLKVCELSGLKLLLTWEKNNKHFKSSAKAILILSNLHPMQGIYSEIHKLKHIKNLFPIKKTFFQLRLMQGALDPICCFPWVFIMKFSQDCDITE